MAMGPSMNLTTEDCLAMMKSGGSAPSQYNWMAPWLNQEDEEKEEPTNGLKDLVFENGETWKEMCLRVFPPAISNRLDQDRQRWAVETGEDVQARARREGVKIPTSCGSSKKLEKDAPAATAQMRTWKDGAMQTQSSQVGNRERSMQLPSQHGLPVGQRSLGRSPMGGVPLMNWG